MRAAYRQIHPVTVLYARGTGDYWSAAGQAWDRLHNWLAARNMHRQIRRGFGLFHDNPQITSSEIQRYDACVELMTGLDADAAAGIGRRTLSGGTYAVHTHVGGYDPMGGLLSHLHREWVPKQGLSVDYDRPFMAIHLNDPRITREVHRRTELCVPVLPLRQVLPVDGQQEDTHTHSQLMRVAVGQR